VAGEVGDRGMEAGNLPVEDIAIRSVLTAEHDKKRLAALARESSSLTVIFQPD
jgi:hypothetical protein